MRRAQAAMEFIMTYGWAILVVLAAIGALAYFGVLNPANLLPEKCFFPAGTDCIEKPSILSNGDVQFVLKNSLGYDINVDTTQQINIPSGDGCDGTYDIINLHVINSDGTDVDCPDDMNPCTIDNGGTMTVTLNCNTGGVEQVPAAGKRYKSQPSITYVSVDSGASHVVSGDLSGKVGAGI
ncbi:MAG: hypothetical protein V1735_07795 [Nanoarchaeota archaeon]